MGKAKNLIKPKKEPTYNLTAAQIKQIKEDAVNKAVAELQYKTFVYMLGLPLIVMHDKFGKLMKKEGRLETFIDEVLNQYEAVEKGYVSLDDLHEILLDEAGIQVEVENKRESRLI